MRTWAAAVLVAGSVACVHVVPPPPVPDRVAPSAYAPAPPAPPGSGQIVFDTLGESALVEEVTGHYEGTDSRGHSVAGATYRTVCLATPCAANLELGQHALRLTSLTDPYAFGTGTVTSTAQPSAFRYALGHNDPGHSLIGVLLLGLGTAVGSAGLPLYIIGTQTDPITHQQNAAGSASAGVAMMIGGGIAVVGGVVLAALLGPTHQPGAGVQWDLP